MLQEIMTKHEKNAIESIKIFELVCMGALIKLSGTLNVDFSSACSNGYEMDGYLDVTLMSDFGEEKKFKNVYYKGCFNPEEIHARLATQEMGEFQVPLIVIKRTDFGDCNHQSYAVLDRKPFVTEMYCTLTQLG